MSDHSAAEPSPSSASRWLMNLFGAGIALAVVGWFFIPFVQWGGSDPPLITERAKWPAPLEAFVADAPLSAEEIAAVEVTPQSDGYFLRMPATEATTAFVDERLTPVDEAKTKEPGVAAAIGQFWDHLPHRWRMHKPRDEDRFLTNADGPVVDVARINAEDRTVLIWHGTSPR